MDLRKYQKYLSKSYINFDIIWSNQESFWYVLTGSFPSLNKRYCSIFRQDKNPGCRFKWYNNTLYFIDNGGFNGKIAFTVLDAASIIYSANKIEAARLLLNNKVIENFVLEKKIINNNIEIKFNYKFWNNDNYFTKYYGLSSDYLNTKECYNVIKYWANTRSDIRLLTNRFINPIKEYAIAYYFDSGNVKLYFPNQEFKWYANTNNDDIYNFNNLGKYSNNSLYITASGKDTYCLEYYFKVNVVGLQSEGIYIPNKLVEELKYFKKVYLIFDNDISGINYTKKLYNYLKKYFTNIIPIYHKINNYDIADYISNNKINFLNERINNEFN